MNANDKSWSNETIALFDKLEAQIRQQQAEIDSLKKQLGDVCKHGNDSACKECYLEAVKK